VIVYASLGALFLPFLAIALLILLNSQRVTPEYRNRLVSNVVLAVSVIPFIVVGVQEVLVACNRRAIRNRKCAIRNC
jgi:hypothetical protein